MSFLTDIVDLQKSQAQTGLLDAQTQDTNSQTSLRGVQADALRQNAARDAQNRAAVMQAQMLADQQGRGAAGTPGAGGLTDPNNNQVATGDQAANTMAGQAKQIQANIDSMKLKQKNEQMTADAIKRATGDSTVADKYTDNARQWQTQIDSATNELVKHQASMAEKASGIASAVMPNGANLPQVLAALADVNPSLASQLPIAKDPATGRPVWNEQTANALKTLQDEGLKAKEKYEVLNQQQERAQAQANYEEKVTRDAQLASRENSQTAIERDGLKLRQDEFADKVANRKDTDVVETRKAGQAALQIQNSYMREPSVKWMNTNGPALQSSAQYVQAIDNGQAKPTASNDAALEDVYRKVVFEAAPRSNMTLKMLKDQYNVPESIFAGLKGLATGKELPADVRTKMWQTVQSKTEQQRAAAVEAEDRAVGAINEIGANPDVHIPRNHRLSTDPVRPKYVGSGDQKSLDALGLGG